MIHFSRYTKLYFMISFIVIGAGIFSIFKYGYNVSIDFSGGTLLQYRTAANAKVDANRLGALVTSFHSELVDHKQGTDGVLTLRLSKFTDAEEPNFRAKLQELIASPVTLSSLESVGPTIGADAIRKTLIAAACGVLVILSYIFYSFRKMSFAVAAVVALLHDIAVVLGVYSIISHFFGAPLDTLFVTALLTTMSFSVHDTIVIFDMIRGELRRGKGGSITDLADHAVTSTMVRSLNNSLTIIFMLFSLVLLGGTSIRYFAIALLIGTVTGVYSSPFIATPVMIWLERRNHKSA
ncbi:MAG: protein translocase subunit SecF [Candidatus Roizmanbacteria bacterium]